jgi:hypothetical protein
VPKLGQVIQIDEAKIQEHLGEVVRSTVEETWNAMLDAEAVVFAVPSDTNGPRLEKIPGRVPTSGTYRRKRAKSH